MVVSGDGGAAGGGEEATLVDSGVAGDVVGEVGEVAAGGEGGASEGGGRLFPPSVGAYLATGEFLLFSALALG